MSEMIERVARALAVTNGVNPDGMTQIGDDPPTDIWNIFSPQARAAIAAMRYPTKEMLNADHVQIKCHTCGGHIEGWHAMIDEALK